MRRTVRRRWVASGMAIGLVLSVAVGAAAQSVTRGQITDEWDNPLEGVTVLAEPPEAGTTGAAGTRAAQTTTTDDNGRFQFVGLASAEWSFTVTLDGYQGLRAMARVSQSNNRPVDFEMPARPSGGAFRERTEFEAEGGIPKFRFEADQTFEFEDADGEAEGTYGIVDLTAILIVRDYDGPDDKFAIATPVVVEFSNDLFTSLTHDGVELMKQ